MKFNILILKELKCKDYYIVFTLFCYFTIYFLKVLLYNRYEVRYEVIDMATQENRSAKRIFEEVLQFYEKYYGVTYDVVNLDTYIIYLDGDEEIGRLYHIDNYGLGFNLSALLNIINEKVIDYE